VRGPVVVVVAMAVVAGTGCAGGSTTPASTATGNGVSTATTIAPLPAGKYPSSISKEVCAKEAQTDIESALGETATVSDPTWIDHLYSCRYQYPTGSMELSVKELSSWAETTAYYQQLARTLGNTRDLENLGQGAFQTTNGSVVVRKDWKVLLVDITGLPAQFGVPPTSSGDVAVTVADVILGCWAGD
jgi:hypothetical protein